MSKKSLFKSAGIEITQIAFVVDWNKFLLKLTNPVYFLNNIGLFGKEQINMK